ncbi:MAG: ATP-binding protein [Candidatus Omnitrophica bacterium]|nr:ATP-binding protein [Candidatus Omnitrophota bacterium]
MTAFTFSLVISGLVNLVFGILVFTRNKRRLPNRVFPLFSFFLSLWCWIVAGVTLVPDLKTAGSLIRTAFAVGAFLPGHFFLFTAILSAPEYKLKPGSKWGLLGVYLFCGLLAGVCYHPAFIQSLYFRPSSLPSLPGPEALYHRGIFSFYLFSVILLMSYSLFRLMASSRKLSGVRQLESRYVFLGVLAGTLFTLLTSLIPGLLGTTLPSRFAPFSSVVMTAIISYAIAKHRIMDIRLVFEITTAYVLSSLILIFVYLAVVVASNKLLALFVWSAQWPQLPLLIGAFLVALVFVPLRSKLQIFLRGWLFKDQYDAGTVTRKITELLSQPMGQGDVFHQALEILHTQLGLHREILLINKGTSASFSDDLLPLEKAQIPENSRFWSWFVSHPGAVVREELLRLPENSESMAVAAKLKELSGEVAVPIYVRGEISGAIVFKQKISGTPFSRNDLLVLEHLGLQFGLALETVSLYQDLSRLNLYLNTLLDNSPAGVIGIDASGRITVFNQEAERLIGLKREEIVSQPYTGLPGVLTEAIERSLTGKGEIRHQEISLFSRANPQAFSVILQTASFYDRIGKILGVQVILSDISEIRTLQEDLRRKEKLASFGAMAARIAHEIKNPLVSIRTLAQLLPSRYMDSEFRESFSHLASKEVERINSLVEEILNFASPRQLYLREVNLIDIIDSTLEVFSVQCEGRNINIHRRWLSNNVSIECDEGKIRQALLNIFLNSRDAIVGEGNLEVELRDDGEMIEISIWDNGTGMSPDVLKRIFDPFFTTKPRGTGLGLPIVASIIDEHGGNIRVESEENRGTLVVIRLPRVHSRRRRR